MSSTSVHNNEVTLAAIFGNGLTGGMGADAERAVSPLPNRVAILRSEFNVPVDMLRRSDLKRASAAAAFKAFRPASRFFFSSHPSVMKLDWTTSCSIFFGFFFVLMLGVEGGKNP